MIYRRIAILFALFLCGVGCAGGVMVDEKVDSAGDEVTGSVDASVVDGSVARDRSVAEAARPDNSTVDSTVQEESASKEDRPEQSPERALPEMPAEASTQDANVAETPPVPDNPNACRPSCQKGEWCVRGVCVMCQGNRDCNNGQLCIQGTCRPCNVDRECSSGKICTNQRCRVGCRKDKDCQGKLVCDSSSLKCKGCVDNADCSNGQVCKNNLCSTCSTDSDCASPNRCIDGACGTLTLSSQPGKRNGSIAGEPTYDFVLSLTRLPSGQAGILQWKRTDGSQGSVTISPWTQQGARWETTVTFSLSAIRRMQRSIVGNKVRYSASAWVDALGAANLKTNTITLTLESATQESCNKGDYEVGFGIADITGPIYKAQMQGFAKSEQKTEGLHMRLFARAFVFKSPCSKQRFVYVVSDIWSITQSIRQAVLEQLGRDYPSVYTKENVMLAGTHTHQGPAGYSHYALYNVTGLNTLVGHNKLNYLTVISGVINAIKNAHLNLKKANLHLSSGDLVGASKNRSRVPYLKNKDQGDYKTDVDQTMTLLRISDANQKPTGLINWFAVHATSLSNSNRLVSGDNKGYASWLVERDYGNDYKGDNPFLAAFAFSNGGDVTPHVGASPQPVPEYSKLVKHAKKQADHAKLLLKNTSTPLTGDIQFRHQYIDFTKIQVDGKYTGQGRKSTCKQALGISFIAGTEDGRGPKTFVCTKNGKNKSITIQEGMPYSSTSGNRCNIPFASSGTQSSLQPCHGKKDVILPIGVKGYLKNKHPWTPPILPIQLVKIGRLAIVGVPFELTTMAGRRLRSTLLEILAPEVTDVVISCNTNAYAGYVTTKEEYDEQHYEGASTQFGPWTLAALRQSLAALATAIKQKRAVSAGPTPPKLGADQLLTVSYLKLQSPDLGAVSTRLGKVRTDVPKTVKRGSTIKFTHWCGHPSHNNQGGKGYVEIQRQIGSRWKTVLWDASPNLKLTFSIVKVSIPEVGKVEIRSMVSAWTVPSNTPTGTYRFYYRGQYRDLLTKMISYWGNSSSFQVQ